MERDEILERVTKVLGNVLGVGSEEVSEDASFVGDLGAESIQSLELVAAFEDEFDIEMDEDAALQVQTVRMAVDFIAQYLPGQ